MKSRKLLAMIMAVALVASFSVPAFASDGAAETPEPAKAFTPNIDFESAKPAEDYVIKATVEQPTVGANAEVKAENFYIDLLNEKLFVTSLPTGVSIAAYSLDGGTKWKTGSLGSDTGLDISKQLNKGMTLVLTTSYDKKAKGPTAGVAEVKDGDKVTTEQVDGGIVIKFPAIKARPKPEKLAVSYSIYADATGKTAGQWALAAKDAMSTAKVDGIQIALAGADKKSPAEIEYAADKKGTWGYFPAGKGINVEETAEGAKPNKTVYLVRTEPKTGDGNWEPASKAIKVSALGEQKAPNMKADYKKEILKGKAFMSVFFGSHADLKAGKTATAGAVAYQVTTLTKETAKAGVDIGAYLSETREKVTLWIAASEKKPASAKQEITLAARQALDNIEYSSSNGITKGKLKIDSKKLEVLGPKEKWGNLPKIEGSVTYPIRYKATAKGGKESDSTFAASRSGSIILTHGTYEVVKEKEKKGVTSAIVKAPEYQGRLVSWLDGQAPALVYGGDDGKISFALSGLVGTDDFGDDKEVKVEIKADQVGEADIVTVDSAAIADGKISADLTPEAVGTTSVYVVFTVAEASADSYSKTIFSQKVSVTVLPKELTVALSAKTVTATEEGAELTFTFTGLVDGDSLDDVLLIGPVKAGDISIAYQTEGSVVTATVTATPAEAAKTGTVEFVITMKDDNYTMAEAALKHEVAYKIEAAEVEPEPEPEPEPAGE